MSVDLAATIVRKAGGPLTKRISLGDDGCPASDGSACLMTRGEAQRLRIPSVTKLAETIVSLKPFEALILGDLADGLPDQVEIDLAKRAKPERGRVARTRGTFVFRPGRSALALLDFDMKGMPAEVSARLQALGGFRGALAGLMPGFSTCGHVVRASTSAGLYRSDTGEEFPGSGGEHVYLLVQDGADIERFLKMAHERAWLAGLGWYLIGGAGQLLDRSIVDRMVWAPERLCFEGGPILDPPLAQRVEVRQPVPVEGPPLDTVAGCPSLDHAERARVEGLKRAARLAIEARAEGVRHAYVDTQAAQIAGEKGIHVTIARRMVEARFRGELLGSDTLVFDDPAIGAVTVAEIMADPDRFDDRTLADPLEGVAYGRGKAKVFVQGRGAAIIHSFAHGGGVYRLRLDAEAIRTRIAAAGKAAVDVLMDGLALATVTEDERDALVRLAADVAGVGIRPIQARLKAEARREARAVAAKTREAEFTRMAEGGRVVQHRPADDAELTPTVTALEEIMAASGTSDPLTRGLDGWPRHVVHAPSAALHLLEPEGNGSGPAERRPPPPSPIIARHSLSSLTLRIEREIVHVAEASDGSVYEARLQSSFIGAFADLRASRLPVLKAIVTTPLVASDGRIVARQGFDPGSGIWFELGSAELAALPAKAPSDEAIAQAYRFLSDELLVDVATDETGKAVIVALLGTMMQVPLLPERPAFFVTAPQRGGGKTTLLHLLSHVVFGRSASAAAWSEQREERRKTIFAVASEGHRMVLFDNIPRGAAISCPEIEKLLTSEEITDRVLGESRTGTASARIVICFTGNNITPAGDMASRSLKILLDPGRPDPENRPFKHVEPVAWVQANRPRLLGALLTILSGNPTLKLRRSPGFQPETRFKEWWMLVGSAVEHAAKLCGHELRFRDLFAENEEHDDEAAGLVELLTHLREKFGSAPFSAREVVKALAPGPGFDEGTPDLLDALVRATGKNIKTVTAHTIGVRFRSIRRRPTEIDGSIWRLDLASDNREGHRGDPSTWRVVRASDRPQTASAWSTAI